MDFENTSDEQLQMNYAAYFIQLVGEHGDRNFSKKRQKRQPGQNDASDCLFCLFPIPRNRHCRHSRQA